MAAVSILDYNLEALSSAGLFPLDGKPSATKSRKLRFWFTLILSVIMFAMNISYFILLEDLTLSDFIALSSQVITTLQFMYRQFYFTIHRKELSSLVSALEGVSEVPEIHLLETEMRVSTKRRNHLFSSIILRCNLMLSCVALLHPIIHSFTDPTSSILILRIACPVDQFASPTYYLLYLWQGFTCYTVFRTISAVDALACSLMLAVAARCELLARAAPQALLPGRQVTVVTGQCTAWVKYHQHYLSLLADVNSLMGPLFLTSFIAAGIQLTMNVVCLFREAERALILTRCAYIVMVLAGLFAATYAGQQVIDKSVQLGTSVLGARQVARAGLKEGPYCSSLQIIMTRCCKAKPDAVSAMGYCAVNIDIFATVLSACVSYILFLLQLKSRDA